MSDGHENEPEARLSRDASGRFLKGFSGNPGGLPGGRPRGSSMMAELERQLAREADDGRTHQERIVAKLIELAEAGDTRAAQLLLARVAPEQLAIKHQDGRESGLVVYVKDFTGANGRKPGELVNPPRANGHDGSAEDEA